MKIFELHHRMTNIPILSPPKLHYIIPVTGVPSSSSAIHIEHREISPVKAIIFPQQTSVEINRHVVRCQETWSTCRRLREGWAQLILVLRDCQETGILHPWCQGLTCSNQSLKFLKFCFLLFFFFPYFVSHHLGHCA